MDRKEIERQRKIGKQLMLVNIIHVENDKVIHGYFSFLSRDSLAEWASLSSEEMDTFFYICRTLDPYERLTSAACIYDHIHNSEYGRNSYFFAFFTYLKLGATLLQYLDPEDIPDYCQRTSLTNFTNYQEKWGDHPVSDQYSDPVVLQSVLRNYIEFFVKIVHEAIELNYDWDVIKAMLRFDITRERLTALERYIAQKTP